MCWVVGGGGGGGGGGRAYFKGCVGVELTFRNVYWVELMSKGCVGVYFKGYMWGSLL